MERNAGSIVGEMPDPVAVARLEERRQALGVATIADEWAESMGGTLCAGPRGSWLNRARGVGLEGPVTDDEIDAMVAFYRDRGHPPAAEVVPFIHETLLEGLGRRGFAITEFLSCWAIGTEALAGDLPGCPAGIEMKRIDPGDPDAVRAWAALLSDGFHESGTEEHAENVRVMSVVAVQPGVHSVGAFDGGRIVGASAMEVASPTGGQAIAGLFSASVAEGVRGRGIQTAMIAERLRIAHEHGAWAACIESKPGIATERNARRMGFSPVYTKAVLTQERSAT
ncbi:MAG: GNAT family N-acetyltransferase [Planctomycetota bacterium]